MSQTSWFSRAAGALIALVGTFVAVFRTRGPHPVVVGLAAVGLFVAGGVLLLDVGVELFSAWLADAFRTSGR